MSGDVNLQTACSPLVASLTAVLFWCAACCDVQVSYGIGLPQPLSVYVDTYRTGKLPDEEIQEAVMNKFDFRPGLIMQVGPGLAYSGDREMVMFLFLF